MNEGEMNTGHAPEHKTSPVTLIVAWLVVAIPLLWGVSQTIQTSAKLFTSSPAPTAAAPGVPTTLGK